MKQFFLCSTAVAALAITSSAYGAGFMVRENSAAGLGMTFAGNGSRAEDASTVFNNPAGMTRLRGTELTAGAAAVFPAINFEGSASVLGGPLPGNNGGQAGAMTGVPHLYGAFELAPDWNAGLAITVPFGNTTNYNDDWYGRYVGLKTSALSFDINPNIAYRVNDQLSIGAGVSAQYFRLDVSAAIPQFLILGAGTPDAILNFKADGWSVGWNVGVLVQADERTRIGATYRSQVNHEIEGALDFAGASPFLGLASGPANSDVSLPGSATVSLTHQATPQLALYADAQWSGWSSFDNVLMENTGAPIDNVQNYEDSWIVSVGAAYEVRPGLKLRGGLGWDQTPVSNEFRTVGVPDQDRIMVGVGLGYQVNESLSLDAAYAHYFATERATMNRSANRLDPVAGVIALQGAYDLGLDYVALSLNYRR